MPRNLLFAALAVGIAAACATTETTPLDAARSDADTARPDATIEATDGDASEPGPEEADLTKTGEPTAETAEPADAPAEAAPEPGDEVVEAGPDQDGSPGDDVAPPSCTLTASDVEGPYYVTGAPWTNLLADADEPGERLFLSGIVRGTDCSPLAGAVLDVWQADATGTYDETPGSWHLRGRLAADDAGRWALETVVPGRYLQASGYRPAHVHFKVSAEGRVPLTTQLYFAGDPYLHPNDSCTTCGSDEPTLIIPLKPGSGADAGTSSSEWTVVLESANL